MVARNPELDSTYALTLTGAEAQRLATFLNQRLAEVPPDANETRFCFSEVHLGIATAVEVFDRTGRVRAQISQVDEW